MTKTLTFSLTFFLLCPLFTFAQKKETPELKVKFGKISEEEIAMKSYDKDPDAPAVVLFDIGYCDPAGNFEGFERHRRIKIFKKEGYSEADFQIFFNRKYNQSVSGLKVICFNMENGKLTESKVAKENIFEENLYKDQFVQKITVPNVREGSIIDIKYTLTNPGVMSWYFQENIPVLWSEYKLLIPVYYQFAKLGQGFTPYLHMNQSRQDEMIIYHWIQKDVPAMKSEKYMTSVEDYRTKISFYLESINVPGRLMERLLPTWQELAKEMMSDFDFGKFIDKKSAMEEEVKSLVNTSMTPIQKAQAIYEYVGKTFETSSVESVWMLSTVAKVKEKKKISATEKNFLFMNMLNTVGIEVAPVLIRTSDEGHVGTPLAVLSRYNRTIAQVMIEKDTFFVDVSGYPQPMKLLPSVSANGYGVKIWGKDNYEFMSPMSKMPTRRFVQATIALNTEGVLSGEINTTHGGYEAFSMRQSIKENGLEKASHSLFKEALSEGKLEKHVFDTPELTSDAPLKGNFKLETNVYVNKTEDKIFVSPFICFGEKENPFKTEERQYDIDFGFARDDFYQLSLTIPDGYKVEEIPKPMRIFLPDNSMKYECLIDVKENKITLNSKLNIKKPTYTSENYPYLKELYAQMLAKMGEQIVLTKTTK